MVYREIRNGQGILHDDDKLSSIIKVVEVRFLALQQ